MECANIHLLKNSQTAKLENSQNSSCFHIFFMNYKLNIMLSSINNELIKLCFKMWEN